MKRLRTPAPYVAALLGLVLAACAGESFPTAPRSSVGPADDTPAADTSATVADTSTTSSAPLYRCATPSIGSVSKVIGAQGGEVNLGPHSLKIPTGALQKDVTITATVQAGEYVRVDFEPHGLQFDRPVELTLSYEHCTTRPPKARYVAYVDDVGNVLELLEVNFHRSGTAVETRLKHFSGYAIAD
jgi:hypothetical protein